MLLGALGASLLQNVLTGKGYQELVMDQKISSFIPSFNKY